MSRTQVEAMLDATGWAWSAGLSALLDQVVLDEEAAK
jgi:hypothetical protein